MSLELEAILRKARESSWRTFGKKIRFYVPSFASYQSISFKSSGNSFPSLSITGNSCALRCKHCGGKVLSTMIPATDPKDLIATCAKLSGGGAKGCLISGGCLSDGSMPLERFIDAIAYIKKMYDLKIAVHTGIIDKSLVKKLKDAGVDVAMIDIIGSEETIKEIYNLNVKVKDFEASLKALNELKMTFVPHIIIGLHYGMLKGEINALNIIKRYNPSALVAIVLMPLKGTPMENIEPPRPEDIAKILAMAKLKIPHKPLALGCMRPKGNHRKTTDILAIKAGVNGIAFPEEEAIDFARSLGLTIDFYSECCSDLYTIC